LGSARRAIAWEQVDTVSSGAKERERKQLTNAEFAAARGLSAQYVGRIRREGTPDKARAKELANAFRDQPWEEYYRPPIKVGRPRRELPFPFKAFVLHVIEAAAFEEKTDAHLVAARMEELYGVADPPPPDDFDSLETFKRYIRSQPDSFNQACRDVADHLWDDFKAWRLGQLFDQFKRDGVDDSTMRLLLTKLNYVE
jgi:transcriptional regulator with XRE-family HTH domain